MLGKLPLGLLGAALFFFAGGEVTRADNARREAAQQPAPELPAWNLAPRGSHKADEYSQQRKDHPELYGVTAPPQTPIRPFAEFEPTQRVLMRPVRDVGAFHLELIEKLKGHVPIVTLLHSTGHDVLMQDALETNSVPTSHVEYLNVQATDSVWTRDYGPLSVLTSDHQVGFVDFRYYHQRTQDDAVPSKAGIQWGVNVYRPTLGYEGGNFMADRHGTCYATEKVFTQNAGWSSQEVTTWMREYLGCQQLVVLRRPENLGTGHIDMFAKLMWDDVVVLGTYDPTLRPTNAAILDENEAILHSVENEMGNYLNVYRVPLPWLDDDVWYTYTNSLIVNDLLLVPHFTGLDALEQEAISVYQQARPDLTVETLNCDHLIPAGGAIHCVTMTIPTGDLTPFEQSPALLCESPILTDCEDTPLSCKTLPVEGRCQGDALQYCGINGYPTQVQCPNCCGWQDTPYPSYTCLPQSECTTCRDECNEGSHGCSDWPGHMWTCGDFDFDHCLERMYLPCMTDQWCNPDSQVCKLDSQPQACSASHTCANPGQRRCGDDGAIELCTLDEYNCFSWTSLGHCGEFETCHLGVCKRVSFQSQPIELERPDVGNAGGCSHGSTPSPPVWLGLLLLWVWRRTHQATFPSKGQARAKATRYEPRP